MINRRLLSLCRTSRFTFHHHPCGHCILPLPQKDRTTPVNSTIRRDRGHRPIHRIAAARTIAAAVIGDPKTVAAMSAASSSTIADAATKSWSGERWPERTTKSSAAAVSGIAVVGADDDAPADGGSYSGCAVAAGDGCCFRIDD